MEFSAIGCVHLNQWLSNWFLLFSAEHLVGMDSDSETECLRETNQETASLRPGRGPWGTRASCLPFLHTLVALEALPWSPERGFQDRVQASFLKYMLRAWCPTLLVSAAGFTPLQAKPAISEFLTLPHSSSLPPIDLQLTMLPPDPGSLGDSLEEVP